MRSEELSPITACTPSAATIAPEAADDTERRAPRRAPAGRGRHHGAASAGERGGDETGRVQPFRGDTSLFITPGYRFRSVGALLTNFHLPRSTLFMLVGAFAGQTRMRAAYAHAIASGYRFYSYGDACLLERA